MHRLQSVTNNMQNSLNNLAEKANIFPLKGINEPDIKLFKRNMDVFKDYTNCYNYSIYISSQGVVDYFLEVLQNLYNEWLSTASFEVHHLIYYRHKTYLIISVTEIICKTAFRDCMITPSDLAWSMFHLKLFEPYKKIYCNKVAEQFITIPKGYILLKSIYSILTEIDDTNSIKYLEETVLLKFSKYIKKEIKENKNITDKNYLTWACKFIKKTNIHKLNCKRLYIILHTVLIERLFLHISINWSNILTHSTAQEIVNVIISKYTQPDHLLIMKVVEIYMTNWEIKLDKALVNKTIINTLEKIHMTITYRFKNHYIFVKSWDRVLQDFIEKNNKKLIDEFVPAYCNGTLHQSESDALESFQSLITRQNQFIIEQHIADIFKQMLLSSNKPDLDILSMKNGMSDNVKYMLDDYNHSKIVSDCNQYNCAILRTEVWESFLPKHSSLSLNIPSSIAEIYQSLTSSYISQFDNRCVNWIDELGEVILSTGYFEAKLVPIQAIFILWLEELETVRYEWIDLDKVKQSSGITEDGLKLVISSLNQHQQPLLELSQSKIRLVKPTKTGLFKYNLNYQDNQKQHKYKPLLDNSHRLKCSMLKYCKNAYRQQNTILFNELKDKFGKDLNLFSNSIKYLTESEYIKIEDNVVKYLP
tara:strand:+ start:1226 stop:3163 length:1938 start_codon:yes stop_codon:yes gene_type:complete